MTSSDIEFPLDDHQLKALLIEAQRQDIQISDLVPQLVDAYLESLTGKSERTDPDPSA